MLDGYSVMISMVEGKLTRVLVDATVAIFDEAEMISPKHAGKNNLTWHKVAVVCR
jgi:hypothetical protein